MRNVPFVLGVSLLLALLTWLLLRGIDTNAPAYALTLRALDDYALAEASLHRDVLQARAGLLRDYDSFTTASGAMEDAVARLRSDARAAGLQTAIVTSNSLANVQRHLARAGSTHRFDAIVCADGDPLRGKPAPTLYLEALERLGRDAGQAIALEDSPNGVAAARDAGLYCIAVPSQITRGAPGLGCWPETLS